MRRISWIKPALKEFVSFPQAVQEQMKFALQIAAAGQKADIAKPMKGLGSGVFELAVPHRGDAYRAIYALQIGDDIWGPRVSEEIDAGDQDAPPRDRRDR